MELSVSRWYVASGLTLVLICFTFTQSDACSCKLEHPQMHFCNAHFAFVARVKSIRHDEFNTYYGIKILKEFKLDTQTKKALKVHREVYSPKSEIQCGVQLEKEQQYMLTGRMLENELRVSLCDFHQPWLNMTTKQKKGFKLLYNKGCSQCKVVACPWWSRKNCKSPLPNTCAWDTLHEGKFDCQGLESVCMKQSSGICGWNRSMKFRQCLKLRKEHKQRLMQLEP